MSKTQNSNQGEEVPSSTSKQSSGEYDSSKVTSEDLKEALKQLDMSVSLQSGFKAPVHDKSEQELLLDELQHLPYFRNTFLRTFWRSDRSEIENYKEGLGSLFHHWSNVLSVYGTAGMLEKTPNWFVQMNKDRIHPDDTSSAKLLEKYFSLLKKKDSFLSCFSTVKKSAV